MPEEKKKDPPKVTKTAAKAKVDKSIQSPFQHQRQPLRFQNPVPPPSQWRNAAVGNNQTQTQTPRSSLWRRHAVGWHFLWVKQKLPQNRNKVCCWCPDTPSIKCHFSGFQSSRPIWGCKPNLQLYRKRWMLKGQRKLPNLKCRTRSRPLLLHTQGRLQPLLLKLRHARM